MDLKRVEFAYGLKGVGCQYNYTYYENYNFNKIFYYYCPRGYSMAYRSNNKELVCRQIGLVPEWQCPFHAAAGNPIQTAMGDKIQREVDYSGASSFPLRFERTYNSGLIKAPSALGYKWLHNYDLSIAVFGTESQKTAYVYRSDGRVFYYNRTANGTWVSNPDVIGRLESLADTGGVPTGWRYTTADDSVETYDATGKLIAIASRGGLTQTLAYNSRGLLTRVTDSFGRALSMSYDDQNRLQTLVDPAGQLYVYRYDVADNLVEVTYPDGKSRIYLYEDSRFRHALTGILDENGARFATYSYDAQGQAVSSERAGGVDKVTLAYNSDGTTKVTDARGAARTYGFQIIWGVRKNTTLSQPCGSGCGGSAAATTYDANGNVASRTDFNGVKTTYAYDLTRNLETSRTEAAGTPQARTITTQWHPTFRLPIQVTEPGKRTAFSYDDRGNLLSRAETALDTNASRVWRYTYNANGQVLTADGPRTDVADVTAYEYWPADAQCPGAKEGSGMAKGCRGQLQRATNAAGHVTEYLKYNAHGQLLQRRDPNGAERLYAYDARQRLTARTEAGLTTTYRYDPRGLLDQISLPEGAVLSYHYDAAHRLIGIRDNLGNRVSYTLDPAGNRLQEQLYDPTGTLARQIDREFDALSRMRRETLGVTP